MHTPGMCLITGLRANIAKHNNGASFAPAFELGWLAGLVGQMLETEGAEKRERRAELHALLREGRRLLVAEEAREKAATAPAAICGNAATGEPCRHTNIAQCAGCGALVESGEVVR